jgi:hypothetical protein
MDKSEDEQFPRCLETPKNVWMKSTVLIEDDPWEIVGVVLVANFEENPIIWKETSPK